MKKTLDGNDDYTIILKGREILKTTSYLGQCTCGYVVETKPYVQLEGDIAGKNISLTYLKTEKRSIDIGFCPCGNIVVRAFPHKYK